MKSVYGLRVLHGQPLPRRAVMIGIEIDADEPAAQLLRRDQRGSGAREWIENDIAGLREGGDQRLEGLDRLLRRVQAVAGIVPVDNIRRRAFRERRECPWPAGRRFVRGRRGSRVADA